MKGMKTLCVAAVLAAAVTAGPAGADANDAAFQRQLRAQNAAHLKETFRPIRQPTSTMINPGFSEPANMGPWELRSGRLRITVEMEALDDASPDAPRAPILTLKVDGQKVLKTEGSEAFPNFPAFLVQLAELDKSNAFPEIVFSSYTGGAHCCSDTRVITMSKNGKKWREIEVGSFDGEPLAATDLDGDDRFEFAVRDNAFLYAFGCYACSFAPLKVLRLDKGQIVDVSTHKDFRDAHREWLVTMIGNYDGGSQDSNGFLAGYVAQKIRLGEGRQAFKFARKYHDKSSDWGLEQCSVKTDAKGDCPGKMLRFTFPEALKRFLVEYGYRLDK